LDDGFVTTAPGTRSLFYGPTGTFDPTVFELDTLTEDVASVWMPIQSFTGNVDPPTQFKGPITILNGELDPLTCNGCIAAAFKQDQKPQFPHADLNVARFSLLLRLCCIPNFQKKNLEQIIIPGQGHDLNLEFGAAMAFRSMIRLFKLAIH